MLKKARMKTGKLPACNHTCAATLQQAKNDLKCNARAIKHIWLSPCWLSQQHLMSAVWQPMLTSRCYKKRLLQHHQLARTKNRGNFQTTKPKAQINGGTVWQAHDCFIVSGNDRQALQAYVFRMWSLFEVWYLEARQLNAQSSVLEFLLQIWTTTCRVALADGILVLLQAQVN